jgi:hypothetical protein
VVKESPLDHREDVLLSHDEDFLAALVFVFVAGT